MRKINKGRNSKGLTTALEYITKARYYMDDVDKTDGLVWVDYLISEMILRLNVF